MHGLHMATCPSYSPHSLPPQGDGRHGRDIFVSGGAVIVAKNNFLVNSEKGAFLKWLTLWDALIEGVTNVSIRT